MRAVHTLAVRRPHDGGAVLTAIEPRRVEPMRHFQGLTLGRLRWKLGRRIKERWPFRVLLDGRFSSIPWDGPWPGLAPKSIGIAGRRFA